MTINFDKSYENSATNPNKGLFLVFTGQFFENCVLLNLRSNKLNKHLSVIFTVASGFVASFLAVVPTSAEPLNSLQESSNQSDQSLITSQIIEKISLPENEIAQVTSVSQLSDVRPNDWAFTALQSLVERYGCIAGYPDSIFRGNQATSRFEFAAGLNACLDKINEIVSAGLSDKVSREDLETLQKLQEDFAAEIATLRGRVDTLEAKTTKLESQQFSTTTKLNGEAIMVLTDTFGNRTGKNTTDPTNTTLSYRVRLNFNTSFTGKDLLRLRLQSGNISSFNAGLTGTNMTRLGFDANTNNQFQIDDFFYRFPISDQTTGWLLVSGYGSENIAPSLNPLESGGRGSISRFGRFSPTYRIVDGSGFGISHKFSDAVQLALAYRSPRDTASNPNQGLFGGSYGALAQLTFSPSKQFKLGLHYARTYFGSGGVNLTGSTGSNNARQPFGNIATSANTYGLVTSYEFTPQFIVSGWGGFTNARSETGTSQSADSFNFALTFAFPDLFQKGNLGGLIVGVPPKATSNTNAARVDKDTSIHLEAFYRYQLSRNIAITPGLLMIFSPENNSANATQLVGLLRTTFSF